MAVNDPASSLLAVTAHPDDAELWIGGTLAIHARQAAVTVAVERHGTDRADEALEAAAVLGADVELSDRHTQESCLELLRRKRPEVLVVHPRDDMHADHRRVTEAVLAAIPLAVIETGCPRRVYACDTYESLTLTGPFDGRVIVDVSETFETKLRALRCHRSQPLEHFAAMASRMAATWGGRIGRPYAEAFAVVPVLGRVPGVASL
jgi:LmbE family N-acetylglucosaminyl deacetylase